MARKLIISVVITTLISIGAGFALAPILGFTQSCLLVLIMQLIGNWFYNDYKIRRTNNEQEQILNERLDILSRNLVKFDCPCSKNVFEEIVYVSNDNNVFECPQCQQQIKVDITLTPIVVTKIIDIQNTLEKIKELDISEEM
jgi:hypothetical protein